MPSRLALLVVLACAGAASAQPLYRWTDENGRVHITDTPPPASARNVRKIKPVAPRAAEPEQSFELRQAMRDFPVTLYTAPNCKEPCAAARGQLNKRAVPFKEVQVWDQQSIDELRRISDGEDVPTLVVGRSVHRGFGQEPYDALLDAARYPRAGTLRPRAQAAPPLPEGYNTAAEPRNPSAETPGPSGPYAPRPPRN
jgi:hypothetical protein